MVGTTYAYSIYSPLLESRLGYSQTDLEIVASVGNTGFNMSLVAGFIFQAFGLHATVLLGACLIFVGTWNLHEISSSTQMLIDD